ncbi:MAG: DNA adenine methylase [Planctomycetes bacterium]|nr:DNA adenine methylase [Planctomycetota bacterium]
MAGRQPRRRRRIGAETMRLIGNKTKLLGQIEGVLAERSITGGTLIDIFSGTSCVGRHFKRRGFRVLANDFLSMCYTQAVAAVEVSRYPTFRRFRARCGDRLDRDGFQRGFQAWINELEDNGVEGGRVPKGAVPLWEAVYFLQKEVEPRRGLIFRSFCPGGPAGRRYFTDSNGEKIDGILGFLRSSFEAKILTHQELHLLLASLIDAADRVANISGTYGAFLKSWQANSRKELTLRPPEVVESPFDNRAYQRDANELVREIEGDVLYIDPPYNKRQYGANYHVMEIIADHHRVDDLEAFEASFYGKTGLRPYDHIHSAYSVPPSGRGRGQGGNVLEAMRDLILSARVRHVVVSYNEEGLLSRKQIGDILACFSGAKRFDFARGLRRIRYKRFRSDRERAGEDGAGKRKYRVLRGRRADEIEEWLFFASRDPERAMVPVEEPLPARAAASSGTAGTRASHEAPVQAAPSRLFVAGLGGTDACIAAEERLRRALADAGFELVESMAPEVEASPEAAVILGGDGFLIEFLHRHDFPEIPLFGINFGTVGFLMNAHEGLDEVPMILRERRFIATANAVLAAEAELESGERRTWLAFNEVVLERQSGQSVRLRVAVDGAAFNRFAGDGFVVSTPAGSTAYNLAAGGPAVHPHVPGMILTPLYPHRAEPFHSVQFSVMLPLASEITVVSDELPKRHMRLVADGRPLEKVARVIIRDSGKRVTLLRTYDRDFIRTISRKFIGERL